MNKTLKDGDNSTRQRGVRGVDPFGNISPPSKKKVERKDISHQEETSGEQRTHEGGSWVAGLAQARPIVSSLSTESALMPCLAMGSSPTIPLKENPRCSLRDTRSILLNPLSTS